MGTVSTQKGDFDFQSTDDVIEFVQTAAQEQGELWISGEQPYPCMAVCINGNHAAVNFFQAEGGDMWLSCNDKNQEEVTFMADGDEWRPDASAVIDADAMYACIREFLDTHERPNCIQWQEL